MCEAKIEVLPVDLKDFHYKNVVVTAENSLEIAK